MGAIAERPRPISSPTTGRPADDGRLGMQGVAIASGAVSIVGGLGALIAVAARADTRRAVAQLAAITRNPGVHDAVVGARELTPHEIRRSDVAAFVADSPVKDTFFHASKGWNAHLRAHGLAARMDPQGVWGEGFYAARIPLPFYGPETTAVVVKPTNPLSVKSLTELERVTRHLADKLPDSPDLKGLTPAQVDRRILRAAGHDAILIRTGARNPENDWVVVLDPDIAKVVVTDPPGSRRG
ncbi:MAG: hypothetical protein JWO69_791 [Thermoleophilia bacterium]|nr:hypothetical protein [Thermoleophilia bacterium]